MPVEIDLGGIYVAPFALNLLVATPLFFILRWVLSRSGLLFRLWYLALCEAALFIGILFLTFPLVLH